MVDIGLFATLRLHFELVKVGGNQCLPIEDIGIGILNPALPNGKINHLLMQEVQYVSTLCHNLFAENFIKYRIVIVVSDDYVHVLNKNDLVNPIFVADKENEISRICQTAYKVAMPPMIVEIACKATMPPIIAETAHLGHKSAMSPMILQSA